MSVPMARPVNAFKPNEGSMSQPKKTPPAIEPMLKKLEAKAGAVKTWREFKIPITSAASDTIKMNGYMIRVSRMVKAASCGSNPGARKFTSGPAKMIPSRLTALIKTVASVSILEASAQAAAEPSFSSFWEKTVMKAVDSAPSAKRSRSRFGKRKAMRKSPMNAVPNRALKRISRTSPSMRLSMTAAAITPLARVLSFFPSFIRRQPCEGVP